MIRIGRYGIGAGRVSWFQTKAPATVRHFLCFWFVKEARPTDVDEQPGFPVDFREEMEGRKFHYLKVNRSMKQGEAIKAEDVNCGKEDNHGTD